MLVDPKPTLTRMIELNNKKELAEVVTDSSGRESIQNAWRPVPTHDLHCATQLQILFENSDTLNFRIFIGFFAVKLPFENTGC